jgi:hypothetical protein
METAIRRDPRGQGDQGEASALDWLLSRDADVFLPFGNSRDVDLMAILDGYALRVQVKTTTQIYNRRWRVAVCTRGGNRSWNGVVKYLEPSLYDRLFVLVADGRRWFIPSQAVGARTAIALGGPKYSECEIDPGRPIRAPAVSLD